MVFSVSDWHKRYLKQAEWTAAIREYIYKKIFVEANHTVLDLGSGTGALLTELITQTNDNVVGLDLSYDNLAFAKRNHNAYKLVQGDGLELPFSTNSFDFTLCHYLLLWLVSPNKCLGEMKRVTKPGGWVLALAEPDYGGRIDHPPEFSILGEWQTIALKIRGADPEIGRQLLDLFVQTGLQHIQTGVLGGQWNPGYNHAEWLNEWEVLEQDINSLINKPDLKLIKSIKELDLQANQSGNRLIYVPTFYAIGQVI